jgi:iron complex outermembrane receptor protein
MTKHHLARHWLWFSPVLLAAAWAQAQTPNPPAADMGRIDVTSGRDNDTQQRRESTASKIVIGREEIERQGDANLGEVLKRMPGITLGGAPGRGSGIRMRGLSAGYTQILLDGQRVPPGFSVESLTPEMVERIEIFRAPTAETGAQAIAGTINIITREGRRGIPDELKLGSSWQGGYASPNGSITHYQDTERWSANYTLSVNRYAAPDHSELALQRDVGPLQRNRVSDSHYVREGLNTTGRLQWKGDPGESLTLMPFVVVSHGTTPGSLALDQSTNGAARIYDSATTQTDNHFALARMNGQWRRKLGADSNMEWKFNVGGWDSRSNFTQTPTGTGLVYASTLLEATRTKDRSASLNGKYTQILGGGHQWVSGAEVEGVRRTQNATATYAEGDADLQAQSMRFAMYSQDEWQLTPHWSAHAGARYEQLTTEGTTSSGDVLNRNSVFTPLLHALWKPNPESRDQVRMSLTRSFKTPNMQTLLARYVRSRDDAIGGGNGPTNADRMGNPNLKPELATGLDVALERYLSQGGVLSASVFHRDIQNLIRNVTAQDPAYGNRWVSTPQNFSQAVTEGVELEAKFRLDQWIDGALPVDVRSNVSFYRSRVNSVLGPNNRLDQQPGMTANLGGDYRLRNLPFTVGGNINYNPGYTSHLSAPEFLTVSQKRVMDLYGLWRVDASTSWRLTLSNLDPRNYVTDRSYSGVESSSTRDRSWTSVQIRLEKKL